MLVEINYSRSNDYVDIVLYNYITKVPPGKYDWKYSVGLDSIIKKQTGDNLESMVDEKINFSEKVLIFAKLLERYGRSILDGNEWYSWGDVRGYSQYVPPNLP